MMVPRTTRSVRYRKVEVVEGGGLGDCGEKSRTKKQTRLRGADVGLRGADEDK